MFALKKSRMQPYWREHFLTLLHSHPLLDQNLYVIHKMFCENETQTRQDKGMVIHYNIHIDVVETMVTF